jgi:superfamily II DNA or RNA helicase
MTSCTIHIKDEVNIKISGLEVATRRKLEKEFKYFQPWAYHSPAYKLGRWDGCVSFFSIGGSSYFNLLDKILPHLVDDGYHIEVDDLRPVHSFTFPEVCETTHEQTVWPKGHPKAGEPIMLRDYQVGAINQFLTNPQCIQEIATGAGKTLMTATLSRSIEPYGRSIVIVPNKDLVRQTYEDYTNLGLDVGVYFGDKKELGKTHTICTWQSLNTLQKRYKDGDSPLSLEEFAEDMIAIIVDEAHQAKADVLKQLLSGPFANVPIRWGLTGTIPKEDFERIGLVACIGNVVNKIAASDLQDLGVLANCHVNVLQLQDTVEYKSYQEELTYLTTNVKRIDFISEFIARLSESGNTLVLVDRVKCGEMICERLGDERSVFVSGAMKSSDRKDHYDEISVSDKKIIVATYGVAAVGINIPRIFNLVLVEPGKSFTRVIQSIGRGIRRAQDKDHVEIWDVTSSAKFSKKHLTVRKKYYQDAKYPFSVEKVKY